MNAFDEAWNMLKALPEQQMFREARRRTNASDDLYFPSWKYGIPLETNPPIMDEHGARSYGTVHPAIASMLARGLNDPIEGMREENVEFAPNLNLDAGRDNDRLIENLKQSQSMAKIGRNYPYLIGSSIASDPQTNMETYGQGKVALENKLNPYPRIF